MGLKCSPRRIDSVWEQIRARLSLNQSRILRFSLFTVPLTTVKIVKQIGFKGIQDAIGVETLKKPAKGRQEEPIKNPQEETLTYGGSLSKRPAFQLCEVHESLRREIEEHKKTDEQLRQATNLKPSAP